MKVITFFNNKGGVGKTTTIVNLASYLQTHKSKKLLLLDLDPQSNSTQAIIPEDEWLNFYGEKAAQKTIYDYFRKIENGDSDLCLQPVPVSRLSNKYNIDLIPGHPNLSIIDDLMSRYWAETQGGEKGPIRRLNWLNQLKSFYSDQYDYIFIDVGPSLGALNRSALLNSDYFITPMASDIFSLLGVKNIAEWMGRWIDMYTASLNVLKQRHHSSADTFLAEYKINTNVHETSRFIGYSVQQYSKRKFKTGVRPTAAYERVIQNIDKEIISSLSKFKKSDLQDSNLKLGDVPYVYSIIPLSQLSNTPIYDLNYESGLRGNQSSSVADYKNYIEIIANRFLENVGDSNVQ